MESRNERRAREFREAGESLQQERSREILDAFAQAKSEEADRIAALWDASRAFGAVWDRYNGSPYRDPQTIARRAAKLQRETQALIDLMEGRKA